MTRGLSQGDTIFGMSWAELLIDFGCSYGLHFFIRFVTPGGQVEQGGESLWPWAATKWTSQRDTSYSTFVEVRQLVGGVTMASNVMCRTGVINRRLRNWGSVCTSTAMKDLLARGLRQKRVQGEALDEMWRRG
mmetsp:Transcript_19519/g.43405  ORF Transcript_19519/g.43405 Transcript_19519/m.43405 type:complete len:133 (+) Transcript_19519:104-502(+)